MNTRSVAVRITIGLLAIASVAALSSAMPNRAMDTMDHIMVQADDLEWGPIGSVPAGAEVAVIEGSPKKEGIFTIRLRFPAGYELPAHWHPEVERVTVLEGSFYMGLGDVLDRSKGGPVDVGGMMILQPQVRHYAWTEAEGATIQLTGIGPWQINYVEAKNDPRNK